MTTTPTTTTDADDKSEGSVFASMKDNSLKTTGYALLVGDAGLFASGMMSGRYKEASSGLLWGLGGLVCAKYANPDAEKQLKLLSSRLSHYLRKEGVEIPKTPDTAALTREDGLIDHIEAFLHKYPSQVLNTVFTIGGVQLLRSGIQHKKGWDAASGALVTAGALAGLLVPESKPDPDHPPTGTIQKAWSWLKEKPLRIPAIAYGLNDVTLTMSAIKEMRTNPAQKSYVFKFMTAASYVFANVMMGMSSKSHHGENSESTEAMDKLATLAAHVINAQPPEVREALIEHIVGFLTSQPDVHMKSEQLSTLLHDKLKAVAGQHHVQGGWQQRVNDQNATQAITPAGGLHWNS